MQFVRINDLRAGMRLARPIYSKQGVMLFDRDSKLTAQGISSVKNFGLIGLFILEPAEPAPPMSPEDIEFERFQTMNVSLINEELTRILNTKKQLKLQTIANNVTRAYGHLEGRINFIQSLRSREDFVYKHALNTAILCAMISHVMNVKLEDQNMAVLAALVHDIGKLSVPGELLDLGDSTPQSKQAIRRAEVAGYELFDKVFGDGVTLKRVCMQSQKAIEDAEVSINFNQPKMVMPAKILAVADVYDSLTAMKFGGEPMSEVAALKYLIEKPDVFEPEVVKALVQSVNILVPGVSVELNSGEKALVISANEDNVLYPMVLSFRDNTILDLSDRVMYGDLEIVDIMKTLDNRYVIDTASIPGAH